MGKCSTEELGGIKIFRLKTGFWSTGGVVHPKQRRPSPSLSSILVGIEPQNPSLGSSVWPKPWEKLGEISPAWKGERREQGRVWSLGTRSRARLIGKGSGGRDLLGPSPLPAGAFIPRLDLQRSRRSGAGEEDELFMRSAAPRIQPVTRGEAGEAPSEAPADFPAGPEHPWLLLPQRIHGFHWINPHLSLPAV